MGVSTVVLDELGTSSEHAHLTFPVLVHQFGMTFEQDFSTGHLPGSIQWDGVPACNWMMGINSDVALVQCAPILPFDGPEVEMLLRAVETAVYKALKA